jgi:hypothetical protein
MRETRGKRKARTNMIERRAAIAPYIAELKHRTPPLVIKQAAKLIAILIGARHGATH